MTRRAARARAPTSSRARSCPARCSLRHTGDLARAARDRRRPRHAAGPGEPGGRRRARPAAGRARARRRVGARAARRPRAAERMRDDGLVVAADLHPGRVRTVAARRATHRRAVDGRHPSSPTAASSAGARRRVRPRAARRAVQRARRAAPPARRALARAAATTCATSPALQRDLLAAAAARCGPAAGSCTRCARSSRDETLDVDEWAARELPEFVAEPPPGAPWRRHGRGALLVPSDARHRRHVRARACERRRGRREPPAR